MRTSFNLAGFNYSTRLDEVFLLPRLKPEQVHEVRAVMLANEKVMEEMARRRAK